MTKTAMPNSFLGTLVIGACTGVVNGTSLIKLVQTFIFLYPEATSLDLKSLISHPRNRGYAEKVVC